MKTSTALFLAFMVTCVTFSAEPPSQNDFWIPLQAPPTKYFIEVKFDLQNNRLEGTEKIVLENSSDKDLTHLMLENSRYSKKDSFSLKYNNQIVQCLTGNGLSFSQTLVALPQPLRKEESVTLDVQFTRFFQSDGDILKSADWYPRLGWGRDTADEYEVKIDCPQEYTLAASGVLDEAKKRYSAKGIRSFGIVVMRNLKVLHATSGDTVINCYYEVGAEQCAELITKTAVEIIDFYRNWLGFYPHKQLHIVPGGMSNPAGGYPIATSIVGIHGQKQFEAAPESHWRFITAHEIGHQYWMEHVLQAPDEFWLMIGLCVYADRAFMRAKGYGDKHEREMMWRYIQGVRENLDTRINRTAEDADRVKFDYNNIVIHGKGFSIISALAYTLGKETFESAYRRCLKEYAGRPLDAADFQRICEEESQQNLDGFFNPWLCTNKFLSYEIASQDIQKKEDGFEIKEKITNSGTLRMSIPVTTYFEDGSSQVQYTDRLLDENVLTFISKSPLKEIELDSQGELPLVIPPPEATLDQLKEEIEKLEWSGDGEKALAIYKKIGKREIEDEYLLYQLAVCLFDGKHYEESLKMFTKSAELGQKGNKKRVFIGLVWQGHILDLLNRREAALACYRQALDTGYDDYFQYDQYGMKVDRAWVEERIKTPFTRN